MIEGQHKKFQPRSAFFTGNEIIWAYVGSSIDFDDDGNGDMFAENHTVL